MILNDESIQHYCTNEKMIQPFNPMLVNSASYDLTLFHELIEITPGAIQDSSNSGNASHKYISERKIKLSYGQTYLLQPGVFILASSVEYLKIPPTLAAEVKLKSTTARKGIGHVYSGWIDPGFEGQVTFELFSHVPVLLEPGKPIAQIIFNEMLQVPVKPYRGKYQHQTGPTPARSEYDDPKTSFNVNAEDRPFLSKAWDMGVEDQSIMVFNGNTVTKEAFTIPPSVDQIWSDRDGNIHIKEPNDGREHTLTIREIQEKWDKGTHPAQTVADWVSSIVNPIKEVLKGDVDHNSKGEVIRTYPAEEIVRAIEEEFGPGQDSWSKRPITKVDRDWSEGDML